jgi:hypothetical protein
MTSTRLVSVLLAVGFLSGCAGPQMMAKKAERKQLETECRAIGEDPRLDPIRNEYLSMVAAITARYLANQEVPSAEEGEALLVYSDLGACITFPR